MMMSGASINHASSDNVVFFLAGVRGSFQSKPTALFVVIEMQNPSIGDMVMLNDMWSKNLHKATRVFKSTDSLIT